MFKIGSNFNRIRTSTSCKVVANIIVYRTQSTNLEAEKHYVVDKISFSKVCARVYQNTVETIRIVKNKVFFFRSRRYVQKAISA